MDMQLNLLDLLLDILMLARMLLYASSLKSFQGEHSRVLKPAYRTFSLACLSTDEGVQGRGSSAPN